MFRPTYLSPVLPIKTPFLSICSAKDIQKQADAFYRSCGSPGKVSLSEMIGIVRLCREFDTDLIYIVKA